jgi:hypothetical protein
VGFDANRSPVGACEPPAGSRQAPEILIDFAAPPERPFSFVSMNINGSRAD